MTLPAMGLPYLTVRAQGKENIDRITFDSRLGGVCFIRYTLPSARHAPRDEAGSEELDGKEVIAARSHDGSCHCAALSLERKGLIKRMAVFIALLGIYLLISCYDSKRYKHLKSVIQTQFYCMILNTLSRSFWWHVSISDPCLMFTS